MAAGAIAALLTAPKRGEEMRRELAVRAEEVRNEIAARAKDAEWVPIFQGDQPTNGHVTEAFGDPSGSVQEAAAIGGSAAEEAASETAEAINEAYDTVDRETQS